MGSVKYKGYTIRYSRGDWYVDDKGGQVVACVWSKKDGMRWVDNAVKAAAQTLASTTLAVGPL